MKTVNVLKVSLAAAVLFYPAQLSALERPKSVNGERGYLLRTCPRAEALIGTVPLEAGPETFWNHATGGTNQKESGGVLEALAVVLAKPLIDVGMNALASWLEQRALERQKTLSWIATGFAAVPGNSPRTAAPRQCLVLVSGAFGSVEIPKKKPTGDDDLTKGDWSPSWLAAFGLVDAPRIYTEIEMTYTRDMTAFQMSSIYLEYRESGLTEWASKPRDLSLALAFSRRGVAAGATAVLLATDANPGQLFTPDLLAANRSPWVPVDLPAESNGKLSKELLTQEPFTIQARIVESVEPSQIDKLISQTFALVKEPLKNEIEHRLDAAMKENTSVSAKPKE